MIFLIKFSIYFTLSFLILSYPVDGKEKVFTHLDKLAKPYTKNLYKKMNIVMANSNKEIIHASTNMFGNTSQDKINSKHSAVKKNNLETPNHHYTDEEKEALLNILRNN